MNRNNESEWNLIEGIVDLEDDHFKIRHNKSPSPVALVSKGEGKTFIVQFVIKRNNSDSTIQKIFDDVQRELNFCLIDKREKNPWGYAIYHCTTAANIYSEVHWGFYPKGYKD